MEKRLPSQGLFQVNHIGQQHAFLENGFRIMVGKKTGDPVGQDKTAFFIEAEDFRKIACSDLHGGKPAAVNLHYMPDQRGGVSPVSRRFRCRQIFQFANRFAFGGDDADAFQLARVVQGKKIAPVEIAADHVFVRIGDQEQGKEAAFV